MCLAGYQRNPIDVNFHLHKTLEIFDINSADNFWSKKGKEWKVSLLTCLLGLTSMTVNSLFWTFKVYLKTLLETLNKALSSRMEMTRQLAILCTTTYRADMPSVTTSYVQAQGSCMLVLFWLLNNPMLSIFPGPVLFCLVLELAGHNSFFW